MGYTGSPRRPYPLPHPEHPHSWPVSAPSPRMLALRWNPLPLSCRRGESSSPISSASLLRPQGRPAQIHPLMICVWLQRRPHPPPPQRPWEMQTIGALRRHPVRRVRGRGSSSAPTHTRGPQVFRSPITGFQETCSLGGHPGYLIFPGKATSAVQSPVPARARGLSAQSRRTGQGRPQTSGNGWGGGPGRGAREGHRWEPLLLLRLEESSLRGPASPLCLPFLSPIHPSPSLA